MLASKQKTVLVSPLNWGLGHAARLIPIIEELIKKGHTIIIGAYGESAALLKSELPQCTHINLRGFTPRYSKKHSQSLILALQGIPFLFHKAKEYQQTARIVSKFGVDIIISDNRYGVRNKNITSIIITHQVSPVLNKKSDWLRKFVSYFISSWIKRFNQCWIPDITETPNLSGTLSDNTFHLNNIKKIGLLSRFKACPEKDEYTIENLAVISGPEPWRSLFEKDILRLFKQTPGKSVIVRGLPENKTQEKTQDTNLIVYNHCGRSTLNELICSSRNIICRSGYSSLMDLFATGRRALLIPTPGQPEQEYLAEHLVIQHQFKSVSQYQLRESDLSVFLNYNKRFTPDTNNSLSFLVENIL
jgi:UDP-N-acetylglucosamine:LPS N-acetylglucosamine transferase